MYVYVCASRKLDDLIRVSYSTAELVERVDDIKHDITREALRIAGIDKGMGIELFASTQNERDTV